MSEKVVQLPDGAISITSTVGPPHPRSGYERQLFPSIEVGLEGWERAHSQGVITGHESAYAILYAPREVNLACHKRAGVRAAIEAVGAFVLYLPLYSPDLSPIELAFSKLKGLLRTAGRRTIDGVWSFLGQALDAFAPQECRNYFQHCGYSAPDATRNPKRD